MPGVIIFGRMCRYDRIIIMVEGLVNVLLQGGRCSQILTYPKVKVPPFEIVITITVNHQWAEFYSSRACKCWKHLKEGTVSFKLYYWHMTRLFNTSLQLV